MIGFLAYEKCIASEDLFMAFMGRADPSLRWTESMAGSLPTLFKKPTAGDPQGSRHDVSGYDAIRLAFDQMYRLEQSAGAHPAEQVCPTRTGDAEKHFKCVKTAELRARAEQS